MLSGERVRSVAALPVSVMTVLGVAMSFGMSAMFAGFVTTTAPVPFAAGAYINVHEGFMAVGANAATAGQGGGVAIDFSQSHAGHAKVSCLTAQMIGFPRTTDAAVMGQRAAAGNDDHGTVEMGGYLVE